MYQKLSKHLLNYLCLCQRLFIKSVTNILILNSVREPLSYLLNLGSLKSEPGPVEKNSHLVEAQCSFLVFTRASVLLLAGPRMVATTLTCVYTRWRGLEETHGASILGNFSREILLRNIRIQIGVLIWNLKSTDSLP